MKNVLKKIIYGAEVTVTKLYIMSVGSEACLNKYNSKKYEIVDKFLIESLIEMDILEFNSGNFETNERHYLLNEKFVSRENNIKIIKISDIWRNILIYNSRYISLPQEHMNKKIENAFSDLRKQLIRKEKLKKIQSYGSNELL